MSFNLGTAIGYLDLDISGLQNGFKTALGDLKAFRDSSKSLSDRTYALGSAFKSTGLSMTKNITLPVVGAGTAIMAMGNKFESAMSRVQGISEATGEELEALTEQALDLGASTAFSAREVAAGMENLASAGFSVEEIISAMPGLLDLAASSGADLAVSSEIAASSLRGFGLDASKAGHVADIFAKASARTNAQTEDLGEAMKYVAPVASSMSQSIEETAAAIGIMSDAGIKGSQAGTSLRGALSRLNRPTDDMCSVMERLGLSFFDAQGNMLPLNGIVRQLETNLKGLTEEQRNNALVTLFGQNALSGVLALINRGSDDLVELAESFKEADGVASEMANVMMNNTAGSLEQMKGAIETLVIRLQQVLAPFITSAIEKITKFIDKLGSMSKDTLKVIVTLAGVVAAAGPVLTVIGKLLITLSKIPTLLTKMKAGLGVAKTALTGLKAAIAGLSAPVVAIIAAIGVLVAAFVNLWKTNEEFRSKIVAIWEGIKESFSSFFRGITEKINSLGFNFESFGEILKTLWQGLCDFLAPVFIGVFQNISNTLEAVLEQILGVVDFFIAVFKGDWEGAWNAIKGVFESVWNSLVAWFANVGQILTGLLETMCGWFGTTWEETWTGIKEFFVDLWQSLVVFFEGVWDSISSTASSCWVGLKNGAKAAWEGIKSTFSSVARFFESTFKSAWEKVKAVFSTGGKVFSGIKEGILSVFKSVVNSLIKGINLVVEQPFKGLNSVLDKLYNLSLLGIKPFSWLTWRAPIPQIPLLAEGAVLPANNPFLAIVGDQKRGTNVEAPLATIQEAVATVIKSFVPVLVTGQRTMVALLRDISYAVSNLRGLREDLMQVDSQAASSQEFDLSRLHHHSQNGDDYNWLSHQLAEALRKSPVKVNVNVEMQEGGVYLDKERVGQSVAPVVSRVMTLQGAGGIG